MARNWKPVEVENFAEAHGWHVSDDAYGYSTFAKGLDRIWVRWVTPHMGLSGADYFADGITAEVVTSKGGAARWETIRDWFVNGRTVDPHG